jgi:hypothetical protein
MKHIIPQIKSIVKKKKKFGEQIQIKNTLQKYASSIFLIFSLKEE